MVVPTEPVARDDRVSGRDPGGVGGDRARADCRLRDPVSCFPGQTHTLWGWTIRSRMSAMFMGGGYLAGALFLLPGVGGPPSGNKLGVGIVRHHRLRHPASASPPS